MENELDHLGKLLMTRLRDVAFECVEGLCENRFDSPGHREFQKLLASMSPDQREIVRDTVQYCVDGALNDFLFYLDKETAQKKAIAAIGGRWHQRDRANCKSSKRTLWCNRLEEKIQPFQGNNGKIAEAFRTKMTDRRKIQ